MKLKYLWPALKFACLPTLSILVLLFFGFFSISATLAFISSSSGWAIALRVVAVLLEIGLVAYMYKKYEKEDLIKNAELSNEPEHISDIKYVRDLNRVWGSSDKYLLHRTSNSDIVLIERQKQSS